MRTYEFTFRSGDGESIKIRHGGNTRRAAERRARGVLLRKHHRDPVKFYTVSTEFISSKQ